MPDNERHPVQGTGVQDDAGENVEMCLSDGEVKMLDVMFSSHAWNKWQEIKTNLKQVGAEGVLTSPSVTAVELFFRQQGAWLFEDVLDDTVRSIQDISMGLKQAKKDTE